MGDDPTPEIATRSEAAASFAQQREAGSGAAPRPSHGGAGASLRTQLRSLGFEEGSALLQGRMGRGSGSVQLKTGDAGLGPALDPSHKVVQHFMQERLDPMDAIAARWEERKALALALSAKRTDPAADQAEVSRQLQAAGEGVLGLASEFLELLHRDWYRPLAMSAEPASDERVESFKSNVAVARQCEELAQRKWADLQRDMIDAAQRTGLFDDVEQAILRRVAIVFSKSDRPEVRGKPAAFSEGAGDALDDFHASHTSEGIARRDKLFPMCVRVHVDLTGMFCYAFLTPPERAAEVGAVAPVAVKIPCRVPESSHSQKRLATAYREERDGSANAKIVADAASPQSIHGPIGWNELAPDAQQPFAYRDEVGRDRVGRAPAGADKGNIYGPAAFKAKTKAGNVPGERLHGIGSREGLHADDDVASLLTLYPSIARDEEGFVRFPEFRMQPMGLVQGCIYVPPRDSIWLRMVIQTARAKGIQTEMVAAFAAPALPAEVHDDYAAALDLIRRVADERDLAGIPRK